MFLMNLSRPKGKSNSRDDKRIRSLTPENNKSMVDINSLTLDPLRIFDIPSLTNITQAFHKEVQSPIEIQTSIFNSKSLQRCLQHNNVTTLYCITDKRPLCVTCMYQNNLHKKHKVVPLNRAMRELHDETIRNIESVEGSINVIDKLITRSHANLSKSQREFPSIIKHIQQFYEQLQQLLTEKKNQQIEHVQLVWQKMRYEYSTFSNELSRIKIFTLQQIKQIQRRGEEQFLLFNRNICSNLVKLEQIIYPSLCQYHETTYFDELKKFRSIQNYINTQLVLTSPYQEKVRRQPRPRGKQNQKQSKIVALSPTSRKVLKARIVGNQPVQILDPLGNLENMKENNKSKSHTKVSDLLSANARKKKHSLSPMPFKYQPAVSAHKPPIIAPPQNPKTPPKP